MKIKPCPFCCSEELGVTHYYIYCKKCNCCGPDGNDTQDAVSKWNAAPREEKSND